MLTSLVSQPRYSMWSRSSKKQLASEILLWQVPGLPGQFRRHCSTFPSTGSHILKPQHTHKLINHYMDVVGLLLTEGLLSMLHVFKICHL